MRTLRYTEPDPMTGPDVEAWQKFLHTQLTLTWGVNGVYGPKTNRATKAFQSLHALEATGEVGGETLEIAKELGFVEPDASAAPEPVAPPPPPPAGADPSVERPDFAQPTASFTETNFGGRYAYRDVPGSDEIVITDGWGGRNLSTVTIPNVAGRIKLYSSDNTQRWGGKMQFNRRATDQLVGLWKTWDDAGLLGRIVTFGGGFNARYRRRSGRRRWLDLSNHAYGTAFDINVEWNKLGHTPAAHGRLGSVRDLVRAANQFGFYWGGHYSGDKDGMHFEVGRIL